jgi:hypothetical protein
MRAGVAESAFELSTSSVRLGTRFILESASDSDAVANRITDRSAANGDQIPDH